MLLSDYNIKHESTIEVFLRLSGGSESDIDIDKDDINNNNINNDVKDFMYLKANSWHQKLNSIIIKSWLDQDNKEQDNKEILVENIGNFEKVSELKKRLFKQCVKLSKDSVLIFNGQLLKDSMKLFEYKIMDNSIINIDLASDIQIFIDVEDEKNFILINIKTTDYVYELKKLIEIKLKNYKQYNYYFGEMNLIYENIKLDDDKVLSFYRIKNESSINLFKRPLKIMIISLLNPKKREIINLIIKPTDKIKDLKQQIQNQLKSKSNDYEIIFNGQITDDNEILSNYRINYESKLLIRERNDNKIKIRIKHLNTSKITLLRFDCSIITIDEIKRIYQIKERKPVDCQTLFCDRKKILENEHLLNEYIDIKDEVSINLVLNQ